MQYSLKITPKARDDMQRSIDYYNDQQKGLGKRFASVIKETMASIKKMPLAASLIYEGERYKVVAKFPYVIFYRITGNVILVSRVFNTHQQPVYE